MKLWYRDTLVLLLLREVFVCFGSIDKTVEDTKLLKKCPSTYQGSDQHCFKLLEGLKNQIMAQKLCRFKKGHLFQILSWPDQREIEKFLKASKVKEDVWLDGRVEYTYFRPMAPHFHWKSKLHPEIKNIPEDELHTLKDLGNCVVISPRDKFTWHRSPCSQKKAVVCAQNRKPNWLKVLQKGKFASKLRVDYDFVLRRR